MATPGDAEGPDETGQTLSRVPGDDRLMEAGDASWLAESAGLPSVESSLPQPIPLSEWKSDSSWAGARVIPGAIEDPMFGPALSAGALGPADPSTSDLPPVLAIPLPEVKTTENVVRLPPVVPAVRLWESSFEFGINGSEGNNPAMDLRVGFETKRKTPRNTFWLDFDYNKKTTRRAETANRLFTETRYERLYLNTPWKSFAHGTLEYDEFKPYDMRWAGDAGVGRQLYDNDFTSLTARLGTGVSHEVGGPNEDYVPEAVFGLDFERRLGKRQKIRITMDYMPDITEFGEYRLRTNAGWEVVLDQDMNLSLKLNLLDRYDSTPEGAKANDLDYSAVLLWKF